MKNVDYIIIGGGYAGLFFALRLMQNNKSFLLYSDGKMGASRVSAGMVNPVVLKKFTTFWQAQNQIDYLHESLEDFKRFSDVNIYVNENVHRIFHDENEKQLWERKRQHEDLTPFLDDVFPYFEGVENPYGTGRVKQSGRVNVEAFFKAFYEVLEERGSLMKESFNYDDLNDQKYKDVTFDHIVFCEGIEVRNNPYFKTIEINPNKGHQLYVRLHSKLEMNVTLKKKHFLFPLKDDLYFYGGTYDREKQDAVVDDSAVEQLKNGLNEFYKGGFSVEEVHYGFRPTVKDRRPIIGRHENYENYYVFNGLGARGVLNGCFFSQTLYDFIENGVELPIEIDIKRFR